MYTILVEYQVHIAYRFFLSFAPNSLCRQDFVVVNSEHEINISQEQRMDVLRVSDGGSKRHVTVQTHTASNVYRHYLLHEGA